MDQRRVLPLGARVRRQEELLRAARLRIHALASLCRRREPPRERRCVSPAVSPDALPVATVEDLASLTARSAKLDAALREARLTIEGLEVMLASRLKRARTREEDAAASAGHAPCADVPSAEERRARPRLWKARYLSDARGVDEVERRLSAIRCVLTAEEDERSRQVSPDGAYSVGFDE